MVNKFNFPCHSSVFSFPMRSSCPAREERMWKRICLLFCGGRAFPSHSFSCFRQTARSDERLKG